MVSCETFGPTAPIIRASSLEDLLQIANGTPFGLQAGVFTRDLSDAMYLARRHTAMSYPEIGRYMGKNHSSVVLAVQRMQALLGDGKELTWHSPAGTRSMGAGKLVELLTEQFA